jgi:hypothetical protein
MQMESQSGDTHDSPRNAVETVLKDKTLIA